MKDCTIERVLDNFGNEAVRAIKLVLNGIGLKKWSFRVSRGFPAELFWADQKKDSGKMVEELVYLAKLAEQAERYDEMADFMCEVVKRTPMLDMEQRNLFSVAFKNMIGSKRVSQRILHSMQMKLQNEIPNPETKKHLEALTRFLLKVNQESEALVERVDNILQNLIPATNDPESLVFFYKMRADYQRYAIETHTQQAADTLPLWLIHRLLLLGSRDEGSIFSSMPFELISFILSTLPLVMYRAIWYKTLARQNYKRAQQIAKEHLATTHPIRLGVALNYSVFFYECMGDWKKAQQIQNKAFHAGLADLDQLSGEDYKDATCILQLLTDGVKLYMPADPQDSDDDREADPP
jgi:14-3-3 protein epsilon